jgi:predicted small lipoprotein YifL
MRTSFWLLTLPVLLAACGQKGPLYLPKQKPPADVSATASGADAPPDNKKKTSAK